MDILLVDDNYQMLEFLDQSIDWEREGLNLVAKCEDGEEALAITKEHKVDILVTDIDMPKMNGLQLIENVQQLHPHVESIIISSYDEFKYAQKAIQLLVSDYILKDDLDGEVLLNKIKQIITEVEEKQANQLDTEKWKSLVNENQLSIKRQWIRNLVDTSSDKSANIERQLQKYEIRPEKKQYLLLIGKIRNVQKALERFGSADLIMIAVEKLSKEFFEESVQGFVYDEHEMVWIVPYIEKQEFIDIIQSFQQSLIEYFNIQLSFVYHYSEGGTNLFFQTLKEMVKLKHEWFYVMDQSITDYQHVTRHLVSKNVYDLYGRFSEELKNMIRKEDSEIVEVGIEELFKGLHDDPYHPEMIKTMSHKIFIDIIISYHFLSKLTAVQTDNIHKDIQVINSLEQLKFFYSYYTKKIISGIKEERKTYRPEIWNALVYIDENIEKRLTLDVVAGELYLNPTYFSRIFKREIGTSFVDYVKNRKIEKAAQLLKETNETIEGVALELGYSNSSYFIKQFKSQTGKTPMEYRQT